MAYTPPFGNSVVFNFRSPYVAPAGNNVVFKFGVTQISGGGIVLMLGL